MSFNCTENGPSVLSVGTHETNTAELFLVADVKVSFCSTGAAMVNMGYRQADL